MSELGKNVYILKKKKKKSLALYLHLYLQSFFFFFKHDFCGFLSSAFKGMDYLIAKNVLFDCLYSFILDYYPPFYNELALDGHKDKDLA